MLPTIQIAFKLKKKESFFNTHIIPASIIRYSKESINKLWDLISYALGNYYEKTIDIYKMGQN